MFDQKLLVGLFQSKIKQFSLCEEFIGYLGVYAAINNGFIHKKLRFKFSFGEPKYIFYALARRVVFQVSIW